MTLQSMVKVLIIGVGNTFCKEYRYLYYQYFSKVLLTAVPNWKVKTAQPGYLRIQYEYLLPPA